MRDTVETNRHMEGTFGEEKLLPLGAKQNASLGNKFTYTECPKVDREKRLRPEHVALEQAHLLAWIVHRQGDKCDNRMIECLFSLKQSVKNRSRHSPCC